MGARLAGAPTAMLLARRGYEAAALMSSFTPLTPAYLQRLCAALGIGAPAATAAST